MLKVNGELVICATKGKSTFAFVVEARGNEEWWSKLVKQTGGVGQAGMAWNRKWKDLALALVAKWGSLGWVCGRIPISILTVVFEFGS